MTGERISAICEQSKSERLFILCTGTSSYVYSGRQYELSPTGAAATPLDRRLAHSIDWVIRTSRPHDFLHFYPSSDQPGTARSRRFSLDLHSPGKVAILVDADLPLEDSQFQQGINAEVLNSVSESLIVTEAERPEPGASHRIVHVNSGFERLYGYSSTDVVGKSPKVLQGQKPETEAIETMRACLDSWTPCTVEIANFRKNGAQLICEVRLVPVRDVTGWWTHWIGFQRDAGKAREIEKRLARQEQILKSFDIGIWRANITTRHLEWDAGMFSLYEVDQSGFTYNFSDWIETLHPDDQPRGEAIIDETLQKSGTDLETLFRIVTPGGEVKTLAGRAESISFTEDSAKGDHVVYGINWDRTREVNLQAELEAQREVLERRERLANMGELASGIGHEIRNPLQIALSYLDDASENIVGGKQAEEVADSIQKAMTALDAISNISDGLRNFGRTKSEQTIFDLNDLINEHISLVSPVLARSGISISFDPAVAPVLVCADRGRLLQVLMNLFSNARDAMINSEERKIWLSASAFKHTALFEVADSGPGIAPEIKDRVFKEAVTTKRFGEGSGLGLQITQTIVTDMGGSIQYVHGEHPGATFRITLPLTRDSATGADTAVTPKPSAEEQLRYISRVLLVDDEAAIRAILRRQMENIGIAVSEAGSVDEALTTLADIPDCDLIVCDLNMPGKTGDCLLQSLKARSQEYPRFILLTGSSSQETEDQIAPLKDDIEQVLRKPFRFRDFEPLLRR